jgi:hypothetical protein
MENKYPKEIPAPLELSEWECSDGKVFYSSISARAHQSAIDKKEQDDKD